MRPDSDNPDDNGSGIDRLADGGGMETGTVHALHRGELAATPAVQHARRPRMLPVKGRRYEEKVFLKLVNIH